MLKFHCSTPERHFAIGKGQFFQMSDNISPLHHNGTEYSKPLFLKYSLMLFVCWAVTRIIFFEGYFGFDDLEYARYAMEWDRLPATHWEGRIFFNFILRIFFSFFGSSELVATLPTLLAALIFIYAVFYTASRIVPISYAFLAGILAAIMPQDVTGSVVLECLTLANMFAALGTACILMSEKDWQYLAGGVLLGLSIYSHEILIIYTGMLALALWGYRWPNFQWKKSLLFITAAIGVFILLEFGIFYAMTGDPLYRIKIISHHNVSFDTLYPYDPIFLPSGDFNFAWLFWPIRQLFMSGAYGILLGIPLLYCLFSWKHIPERLRFLVVITLLYWLWINYGTSTPFKYKPLNHRLRYWYPLALPMCILGTFLFYKIRSRLFRIPYLAALIILPLLILSLRGPWGQNIEITKELADYAQKHSDAMFVTDKYTLDEMYVLNGAKVPANVFSVKSFIQPHFFDIPEANQKDAANPDIVFLYNEQNMWRPFAEEFEKYVRNHVVLSEISGKKYRLLAYCLPESVREKYGWMVRKVPARTGKNR